MFIVMTLFSLYLGNFSKEIPVLIYICIATIISQAMLVYGVDRMFKRNQATQESGFQKLCGVLALPLKTLILGHAFYMGIQIIGDRIVISLVFYVVQIAILLVNINKFENNGYQSV